MGDLGKVASTFRIIDLDADPDSGSFTDAQLKQLGAQGSKVLSYLNLGSCESFRSYWRSAPGYVSCSANTRAQLGPYAGYPNETWMNVGDKDYQSLIVGFVAPRLAARGVDGFYLDNLEIIDHGVNTSNGPCDPACAQGGLDLVRRLREAFPDKLLVMQNATGSVARSGTTGGVSFPSLLDGVAHEEVYAPSYDDGAEADLVAWQGLGLMPGGHPFWVATLDYVGSCTNTTDAQAAFTKSRAHGFSPSASDESGKQQVVCFWGF
jgi:cysteinyl-tRNA synthetase